MRIVHNRQTTKLSRKEETLLVRTLEWREIACDKGERKDMLPSIINRIEKLKERKQ